MAGDPGWEEALAAFGAGEPADLARGPRALIIECCYAGGGWAATSPDLAGFQVYGPSRAGVQRAARDDLAAWLDPAVTLEFI